MLVQKMLARTSRKFSEPPHVHLHTKSTQWCANTDVFWSGSNRPVACRKTLAFASTWPDGKLRRHLSNYTIDAPIATPRERLRVKPACRRRAAVFTHDSLSRLPGRSPFPLQSHWDSAGREPLVCSQRQPHHSWRTARLKWPKYVQENVQVLRKFQ